MERLFRPEFSGRSAWQVVAVSNRLTEERPNLGAELARSARNARNGFGGEANVQLAQTGQQDLRAPPMPRISRQITQA